ncbi:Glutathione transport system permease protein GsiD [Sporomusa ovata DSM 2662]|uniref:Oligopeptide transport system permease protein OppC (TC 3.A.1.5.1) n=1 Tax=Sporomusa ovata TaxID=2378 RepID=A0A0U1KS13_9FIRM|nr:ABC transporter permease subunit [Sporomusa ovata]EQB24988.1 ABC-type dipeptide/oligopeptide/nickel transport system, permease component [Sporomusa ovata DSM 2662]CQR70192.1 Oligopeptide transport system permease protein OppC (TC 3.A.1.5.1) [Sporomusa ovata]
MSSSYRHLSPPAYWGLFLLLTLILVALLAPIVAPYSPSERFTPFDLPSAVHPLGCDDIGHDILTQLILASRVSLLVGLTAAIASAGLGAAIGILAGYCRGYLAYLLNSFIDIVLLIPMLPLMIALAAYLGPSLGNIIAIIGLLGWCSTARVVKSRVLQLRDLPFVEALQGLGIPEYQIILKHIVPNVVEVIAAKFILAVAYAMLSESALSFLGLGDPLTISWGSILYYAFHRGGFVNDLWHWYLPPGLCIAAATLGFTLLGFYLEQLSRDNKLQTLTEDSAHVA